jgi:bifunctional non-homologous end joining protein LigD
VSIASPRFIHPCRPVLAKSPPAGPDWLHELKFDGYRLQVVKDGARVELLSKSGTTWTRRLAALAETLRAIPCRSAVIDAELCAVSDAGVPDFRAMQSAMAKCEGLAVFAFDLLHRDGSDLTQKPLEERRRRLARLLERKAIPCLHLVEAHEDGAALLKAAEAHGFEGIVSKRRSSPYVSSPC